MRSKHVLDGVAITADVSDEAGYRRALAELDRLLEITREAPDDDRAAQVLDTLAGVVARYEEATDPRSPASPGDVIRLYMESRPNGRRELNELVGGTNRASELLTGKRRVNRKQADALRRAWGIPYEALFGTEIPTRKASSSDPDRFIVVRVPKESECGRELVRQAATFELPAEHYGVAAIERGLGLAR